jgi:uncharacterized protein involved in tolerance to divalent cations
METLLVITNCPDEESANAIALDVIEAKLAACVNILPRVQSIYRWQGKVESTSEIPFFQVDRSKLPGARIENPRTPPLRVARNHRPAA